MPRAPRLAKGDIVYHVLNRANARMTIFEKDADYEAFETVLAEAHERLPIRILDYCVMPNHWHMVLWPEGDGELSSFMGWLTMTHTQRWHAHRGTSGSGHVYQGRFKSFPVQDDNHLFMVCKYVARNPVRAGLVDLAEKWRWASLWRRTCGKADDWLCDGPLDRPTNWYGDVNRAESEPDLAALRISVNRGRPFGGEGWLHGMAHEFGMTSTLRPRGRPKKGQEASDGKGS